MQSSTGCRINVSSQFHPSDTEREISLQGPKDAIIRARKAIEDKVEASVCHSSSSLYVLCPIPKYSSPLSSKDISILDIIYCPLLSSVYARFLVCVSVVECKAGQGKNELQVLHNKGEKASWNGQRIRGECTFLNDCAFGVPYKPFPSYLSSPLLPVLRSATNSLLKTTLMFVLILISSSHDLTTPISMSVTMGREKRLGKNGWKPTQSSLVNPCAQIND